MPQDVKKNYISLVNDAPGSEQAAGATTRLQPGGMMDFMVRLAAVLKSRLNGTQGPSVTP